MCVREHVAGGPAAAGSPARLQLPAVAIMELLVVVKCYFQAATLFPPTLAVITTQAVHVRVTRLVKGLGHLALLG